MRLASFAIAGLALTALLVASAPTAHADSCIPTSGGLDYHSYLCTDPGNPKCAVYTLSTTDAGTEKKCYGVL